MSKIKSPRDKKMLRLLHDRRNVFGENDKASRKNIPLTKQRKRQEMRRSSNQPLRAIAALAEEDDVIAVEEAVRDQVKSGKRKLFRKSPDASLGAVLKHKQTGNWKPLIQPWSKP